MLSLSRGLRPAPLGMRSSCAGPAGRAQSGQGRVHSIGLGNDLLARDTGIRTQRKCIHIFDRAPIGRPQSPTCDLMGVERRPHNSWGDTSMLAKNSPAAANIAGPAPNAGHI